MKNILCLCLVVAASLTAFAADASDDAKAVQGIWIPVKAELGGQPMPAAVLTAITLKVNKSEYEVSVVGELVTYNRKTPHVKTKSGETAKPAIAVDNVCAWPNLTQLSDGSIIATIFNQPSHGSMAGDVDCWATSDSGRTWQKRGTPAPHEENTNRMNVAAGKAHNGDLIVIASGWSNRYPEGKKGSPFRAGILDPWVSRSADGGRTWNVDKTAFPAKTPDGGIPIPFGDILPARDGNLCAAVYTALASEANRVFICRSRDDGRTWGEPAPLSASDGRNETAMLHLGNGRWLAAARTAGRDDSGLAGYLCLYASSDDARTWQRQSPLTGSSQHPGHLTRLGDGRILLSYGNRTADRGVDARFSRDEGATWGDPVRVVDFQGDGGYPSSVQLPDGQVLTAYYARAIADHDRYHLGVVAWDPSQP